MYASQYSPSCRVGNWNEEIQLEEDQLKVFLDKKSKGELLIQKTHALRTVMDKPIDVSVSTDFMLHIGDRVMVKCNQAEDQSKVFVEYGPRQACLLAVNVTDPMALLKKDLVGVPISATGCLTIAPNQRTVFRIESVHGGYNGASLRYGEPFCLCTVGENTGKMYLWSDNKTFMRAAPKSRNQEVSFVSDYSYQCHWTVQHRNPLLRLEYEHEPVEANQELIIVHCKTNTCLCVEEKFLGRTPFGREYEISCNTCQDSHHANMDVNLFMLVAGVPGCPVNPVPDQEPAPEVCQPKAQDPPICPPPEDPCKVDLCDHVPTS